MSASSFDIFTNAPGLLRIESLNIQAKFERLENNKGKISWNIPTPASGCSADNQAYCGIIFVLDNKPITYSNTPVEKVLYTADHTASPDLFSGDKIGDGRVIGTFYLDRTTTSFEITDVENDTPYYIAGYPVDCEYRYFVEGVHAYSQNYSKNALDPTTGSVLVVLNENQGVLPTDSTELDQLTNYTLNICVGLPQKNPSGYSNTVYDQCNLNSENCFDIVIDGSKSQTYDELVNELNNQFNLRSSCQQGAVPPNTNGLYFDQNTNTLYQWTGYQYNQLPVYINNINPGVLVANVTYWFNNQELKLWDGSAWILQNNVITLSSDPLNPVCDNTLWFDGTIVRKWNGTTWCELTTLISSQNPLVPIIPCGSFWYDNTNLYKWDHVSNLWIKTSPIENYIDPNTISNGDYWFNPDDKSLSIYIGIWEPVIYKYRETSPKYPEIGSLWFKPSTKNLYNWDGTSWIDTNYFSYSTDPTDRTSCNIWLDTTAISTNIWDTITNDWVLSNNIVSTSDHSLPPNLDNGTIWVNGQTVSYLDNGCWIPSEYVYLVSPTYTIPDGTIWNDTTNNQFFILNSSGWDLLLVIFSAFDPSNIPVGTFWYQPSTSTLFLWNGLGWTNIPVSFATLKPSIGSCWYDTSLFLLKEWNGSDWVFKNPIVVTSLDCKGNLVFTNPIAGSTSFLRIPTNQPDIPLENQLLYNLGYSYSIQETNLGDDGYSGKPSYEELGVGTDGTNDERLKLINDIRYELGYPGIDVELTKEQMDIAVSRAVEVLRQQTGIAYKQGFFFFQIKPNQQRYLLTNKTEGFNKIVQIIGIYRTSSSFLSLAHGSGLYGQMMLQNLYTAGSFDLLSYHLMSQYLENMEILFANRLTFNWSESKRELWIHHRFPIREKHVLIEASVERTEQDIISDRWCKAWIRKYASAVCRDMLAEIRGKFSSLPGASGSISLNSMDLRQRAKDQFDECMSDIENYVIDNPEEYGMGTAFLMG